MGYLAYVAMSVNAAADVYIFSCAVKDQYGYLSQLVTSYLNCAGTVPVFKPTSSPKLDELLKTVREKSILPSYLSPNQQDLISKHKHKKSLEVEPVIVKIGDEEFKLKHIDIMNDIPAFKLSLRNALGLMKTRSDYENIIGLLEGLNKHKDRVLRSQGMGFIARKLGEAGFQDILLELIRQASRTGFTLGKYDRGCQAMGAMSRKAYNSNWDAGDIDKALRWSEQLLDFMEHPVHIQKAESTTLKPERQPDVIGRVLELAAMKASRHEDGKDLDGRVESLARRVLSSYSNLKPLPPTAEPDNPRPTMNLKILYAHNGWLTAITPLLNGMKVAQRVLGSTSEVAVELGEKAAELEKDVHASYEILANSEWRKDKPRDGVLAYERLFGLTSQD